MKSELEMKSKRMKNILSFTSFASFTYDIMRRNSIERKTMSTYSFGADSPLKFEFSDEYAELYNEGLQMYFNAQLEHKARTGQKWTGDEPLWFEGRREAMDALNEFDEHLQKALKDHGRDVPEEDIHEDFLIKN